MVAGSTGIDIYGNVKTVRGTPIVTQFATLQFLPFIPIQSLYLIGTGPTQANGAPRIVSTQTTHLQGIELARIDLLSVTMTYLRAIIATVILLSLLGVLFPGVSSLAGEPLEGAAWHWLKWSAVALIMAVIVGVMTYRWPRLSRREHEIRSYCHDLLGIAVDPAQLPPYLALQVQEAAAQHPTSLPQRRSALIRELLATRAQLASAANSATHDAATDDILRQLRKAADSV